MEFYIKWQKNQCTNLYQVYETAKKTKKERKKKRKKKKDKKNKEKSFKLFVAIDFGTDGLGIFIIYEYIIYYMHRS